jgi:hypothetical protein
MSRRESDREDLLREATALVQRMELNVAGLAEPIVVGFRRDGSASFFFGADQAYQFNTARELRRAYVDGLLYKAEKAERAKKAETAEHGRLIALRRERTESEVALIRSELTADETAAFLAAAENRLQRLQQALDSGSFILVGQVPAEANVVRLVLDWLTVLPPRIHIANAPNSR